MKKLLILLLMVAAVCGAQPVPQTPNLKLNLPPHNWPNWDVLLNQNFTVLDTVVGGLQRSYAGTWVPATLYQMSSTVIWNGYSYVSLIPNNLNQQPDTTPTAWAVVGYVSGPMTTPLIIQPPSGTQAALTLKSTGATPVVQFQNLSAGPDLKVWSQGNTADGTYHLSATNDALSASNDAMTCTRTGATPGTCTFPGGVSAPNLSGPPNTLPQYAPGGGLGNTQVGVDAATGSYLTANLNNEPYVMSPQFAGGAKCDWQGVIGQTNNGIIFSTTGQLTDTTHFTDPAANFNAATDVGGPLGSKWIVIQGVGPNGVSYGFWSQVASVQDGQHITLTTPATTTGSNLSWGYGHDDSAAFNAANAYVQSLNQLQWPKIHLPPGVCMANVPHWQGSSWAGSQRGGSGWICPPGKYCLITDDPVSAFNPYMDVGGIIFSIDETINASCATVLGPTSTAAQCLYPNLITGTQGGTQGPGGGLYGFLAAAGGALPYAVGATIATNYAGSGCTSAPTVAITNGGAGATLPTATANLTGSTVPNVTLTSMGGKMTQNPVFTFTGGGCAIEPYIDAGGSAPKSQINVAAIITSQATGTIGGTTSVPGLADPPIYVGNGGIAMLVSNGAGQGGQGSAGKPNHSFFHNLVFRPLNGPNAANNIIAIADTPLDYNMTYQDIETDSVFYGILHIPPVTNTTGSNGGVDYNNYIRITFNNAIWPFAFYNGSNYVMDSVVFNAGAANNMGPMFLGYPSSSRSYAGPGELRDVQLGCSGSNTNEIARWTGTRYYGGNIGCAGANNYTTLYASDARALGTIIAGSNPAGAMRIYGNHNKFYDIVINAGGSTQKQTMFVNEPGSYDNDFQFDQNSSFRFSTRTTYINRHLEPTNTFDGSAALAHSVAPFTSGTDLTVTCLENTAGSTIGTCKPIPQDSSPSGWAQEVQVPSGGVNILLNSNNVPGYIEQRFPQQKVNIRVTARMMDVNDHAGPQRTVWQPVAGATNLGNVYYQATTTQAGSTESPAGPETLANAGGVKNIIIQSPIDDCPTGATWSLYTSPTSGTEALATSNTPCGTNVTLTAVPVGGGTGGPKITGTQAWGAYGAVDAVNRGAGALAFQAYWTTQVFAADFTNAARGSNMYFNGGTLTPTAGTPGYIQIASIQVEPIIAGNAFDTGTFNSLTLGGKCASVASPAVCGASSSGTVKVPAAATTLTINTTAVAATSIFSFNYSTAASGCTTAPANIASLLMPYVSAISAGTSFTVTLPVAPTTNPACVQYAIF